MDKLSLNLNEIRVIYQPNGTNTIGLICHNSKDAALLIEYCYGEIEFNTTSYGGTDNISVTVKFITSGKYIDLTVSTGEHMSVIEERLANKLVTHVWVGYNYLEDQEVKTQVVGDYYPLSYPETL